MNSIKRISKKFETMMVAATFAEAGEFETAREILREKVVERKRETAERRPRMAARPSNRK